jgi:ParB family transcriptional regulator, chromosome partitioning protein
MSVRSKRPSPILSAASAMIDQASDTLVTRASRFQHSFEATVETVAPDPDQPRKIFGEEDIASLAATMEERGQLQPILVRRDPASKGRWLIVAGERRWRAAKLIGWSTILAIEHDGDPEVASLLENLQRVDLTPVEEARGLQHLLEGKGWTQDQAAEALGKSKSEVSGTLRILTLPEDLLNAVLTSELGTSKNVLVELARVDGEDERERLIQLARKGQLTVRLIRSVREAGGNGGGAAKMTGPRGAKPKAQTGGTAVRVLEKLADQLTCIREGGRLLDARERAFLQRLRAEIDVLLASPQ